MKKQSGRPAILGGLAVVFMLMFVMNGAAQSIKYRIMHDFTGGWDGNGPSSTLMLDAKGNLYGTTFQGGTYDMGVVFKLTPVGSRWVVNGPLQFRIQPK